MMHALAKLEVISGDVEVDWGDLNPPHSEMSPATPLFFVRQLEFRNVVIDAFFWLGLVEVKTSEFPERALKRNFLNLCHL